MYSKISVPNLTAVLKFYSTVLVVVVAAVHTHTHTHIMNINPLGGGGGGGYKKTKSTMKQLTNSNTVIIITFN